ncbi:MAG TPA: hypothetical protein VLH38_01990 [Patescibacteria group bacterium]|nr:hypothetical protein [Patescibacteria group bacterium]
MRDVEVMQVRAMLKEILAVSDASPEDVGAVMTIGTPGMGLQHLSGPKELGAIFEAVEHASPADEGTMSITEAAWLQLESVYSSRVVQPLFA